MNVCRGHAGPYCVMVDVCYLCLLARVYLGMALCTQPVVSAYGADQTLPLVDKI